ncbi:hypothetical protein BN1356_01610 [Streptococcus varani]|uniref:Uncharacterized protein n=1 Tax=Streptococcus varani TaxID=1608583 RepID=A0A0E4CT20_9STRE|nr:WYL domain-containing protein [Streptococcus varani]CQR25269.1 hypothetical protein BN1356_01610 [Streptococcus varani]
MNSKERLLDLFLCLIKHKKLHKSDLIEKYQISGLSVQRDINSIKNVLRDLNPKHFEDSPILSIPKGTYSLNPEFLLHAGLFNLRQLSDTELLAIAQLVVYSKAFTKEEVTRLITVLSQDNANQDLLKNALYHYSERFTDPVLDKITVITEAIQNGDYISFDYSKNFKTEKFIKKPLIVFFSDLYFYVATDSHESEDGIHLENLNKFRINNMRNLHSIKGKQQSIDYANRPQPGYLAHLTGPFSFYGKPLEVTIDFYYDPVYVTDRFPDHEILSQNIETGITRIKFRSNDGYGLKMWLMMQGKQLKVIKPLHLKQFILDEIKEMQTHYLVDDEK